MANELQIIEATPVSPLAVPEMGAMSLDQMWGMAESIARSGLFGMKTPDQAYVLMALCVSEGKNPIQAVRQYHIIQGRPSMRADAMQAEFMAHGGTVTFEAMTDEECTATFTSGITIAQITWTMETAKRAGLLSKQDSMFNKYPRAMLRARCVSEGVRAVMPGVVAGIYSTEEVMDFDASPAEAPRREKPVVPQASRTGTVPKDVSPVETEAAAPSRPARIEPANDGKDGERAALMAAATALVERAEASDFTGLRKPDGKIDGVAAKRLVKQVHEALSIPFDGRVSIQSYIDAFNRFGDFAEMFDSTAETFGTAKADEVVIPAEIVQAEIAADDTGDPFKEL